MCYVLYCFTRNSCTGKHLFHHSQQYNTKIALIPHTFHLDAILVQSGVFSTKFHIFFTASCIGIVLWLLMLRNELIMLSTIYLLGVSICGIKALSINSQGLLKYKRTLPTSAKNYYIIFQLLVQNGLDLLFSWTSILSIVCISCAFAHDPLLDGKISPEKVDAICLVLFGILIVACSLSENTIYYEAYKYIYSWYVVLIWTIAGILVQQIDNGAIHNFILTVVVLCLSIMCLFAKIIVFIFKSTPKSDPLVDPILSTDVQIVNKEYRSDCFTLQCFSFMNYRFEFD